MARSNALKKYDDHIVDNAVRKVAAEPRREKKNNLVRLTEKQLRHARHKGLNPLRTFASITMVAVSFAIVASVIFGQVQLTELTESINVAETKLSELESVEIQLQMKATSNMNVDEIEEYAKTQLGMEKVNNNQVTYVNLAQQDKGIVVEAPSENIFQNIWNTICSWLS